MSKDVIETSATENLNAEGFENRPVCPVCQSYLEPAESGYKYSKLNPDTRWFWCETCQGHLGYHRMKSKWKVDPEDLRDSAAFREFFQVDTIE